jgi:sugar O-acyltransferase (sialic acid O-acetyltransferase NeuD family)
MKIIVIGAGGQARILYEILGNDRNFEITAFIDNVPRSGKETIQGIPILGGHSVIPDLMKQGVKGVIIAIGNNPIRTAHFETLRGMGLEFINAIHPTAAVAANAKLGKGVTISMGAIICTSVRIADNVIINTGAIIDHECEIHEHAHIGPGCSLAGRVTVKKGALVNIGSVVKENVTIGENAVISAGSVVLKDIPDGAFASGTPARIIEPPVA